MTITFFVPGTPRPAGSKRAFAIKKGGAYTGRVVVMDACTKTKSWQRVVREAAQAAYSGPLWQGAVKLSLTFILTRPGGHWRTGKNAALLKADAPAFPITRIPGDLTKLTRCFEDALTGVIWVDDSQVVEKHESKTFTGKKGDAFGVQATIEALEPDLEIRLLLTERA